jgi:hypothetical protein
MFKMASGHSGDKSFLENKVNAPPKMDLEPAPENGVSSFPKESSELAKTTSRDHHLSFDTIGTLRRFSKNHELDPNLPIEELNELDNALEEGNIEKRIEIEREFVENSPYPEVCLPTHHIVKL